MHTGEDCSRSRPFYFNRWESADVFSCGIGRLNFLYACFKSRKSVSARFSVILKTIVRPIFVFSLAFTEVA